MGVQPLAGVGGYNQWDLKLPILDLSSGHKLQVRDFPSGGRS